MRCYDKIVLRRERAKRAVKLYAIILDTLKIKSFQ